MDGEGRVRERERERVRGDHPVCRWQTPLPLPQEGTVSEREIILKREGVYTFREVIAKHSCPLLQYTLIL